MTNDDLPIIEAHEGLSDATGTCMGVVAEVAKILKPWHDEYCLIGGPVIKKRWSKCLTCHPCMV